MTDTSAVSRFHEPLSRENAALLLVDHQIGLLTGVRDIDVAQLKHNVVGLAKAAQTLEVPIVATTTAAESMWGPLVPELAEVLPPELEIIDRSTVNAWHEPRVREAVEATRRQKIIIAGVSTEVCVAFPAIAATTAGYTVFASVDASGTFSETKRAAGLLRMHQAGVILTDYATAAVEMLEDNASPLAPDLYAAIDMPFAVLVGQLATAYAKRS
ncbi:hydrolase [Streptomyces spinoverrucosus]|uniref:Hydrolase n=1 Tax=Streptomyces spinoverrucosus TaxID=284043 RepID=A0A4Y3VWQ4_9ACTN|nr:isochorismatase family protein [Streptomyces spinoverrucosus]GEC10201.1 hydrolase [Streptomyces spinoverrucosus]GHB98307.1 hydrolase [Streptomyces spinoverrucosus]